MTFTIASQNVLFKNSGEEVLADLRQGNVAAIRGMQESGMPRAREAVAQNAKEAGRAFYMIDENEKARELTIDWDKKVFSGQPYRGFREAHGPMPGHETKIGFRARHFQFVELVEKATGRRILVVNTHAGNGATSREDGPGGTPWGPEFDDWKDWSIKQYWLHVVYFLARQMKREVYDAIFLIGDFNARLTNDDEWYYPGPLLGGLVTHDAQEKAIDHLVATLDTKGRFANRRTERGNSDHRLHFVDFTFSEG